MKRTATLETADLEAAINYLEGLDVILRTLHEEQRGRVGDDPLIRQLSELEEAIEEWQPVNYQGAMGSVGSSSLRTLMTYGIDWWRRTAMPLCDQGVTTPPLRPQMTIAAGDLTCGDAHSVQCPRGELENLMSPFLTCTDAYSRRSERMDAAGGWPRYGEPGADG